jgi:hypothetical protein
MTEAAPYSIEGDKRVLDWALEELEPWKPLSQDSLAAWGLASVPQARRDEIFGSLDDIRAFDEPPILYFMSGNKDDLPYVPGLIPRFNGARKLSPLRVVKVREPMLGGNHNG